MGDWVEFMNFPSSWMNLMHKFLKEKGNGDLEFHTNTDAPQLLEGLKEESQVEDSEKKGVGARSLTRSIRGVEGRVGAPG